MIIYLCNALDEDAKSSRQITTDSPAATKKVFGLCHALQHVGVDSCVLSMGRGRQNGSGKYFSNLTTTVDNIEVNYASFWHSPFFTHVVTIVSLATLLYKIKRNRAVKLLVYNRSWHYMLAVLLAKVLRIPCYLDLEDGWVTGKQTSNQKLLTGVYDWACDSGSLLACNALKEQVATTHNLVCYGVSSVANKHVHQWKSGKIQVLFGGSLCEGTGANLFIQGIKKLIKKYPMIKKELHIVIVGFGDMTEALENFALNTEGLVVFRGAISNKDYAKLLDDSHVGLCLKLTQGAFHDSTFPSKVIEISSHGLLLLSTAVSDVPNVFSSEHALLLENDTPEALLNALYWITQHLSDAKCMANRGNSMSRSRFSIDAVGVELADFFKCEREL